jgi:hypothetical protein
MLHCVVLGRCCRMSVLAGPGGKVSSRKGSELALQDEGMEYLPGRSW